MKKVIILVLSFLSVFCSNAQVFEPLTYEELAAPLRAATAYHNQCCDALIQLMEGAQSIEAYISKDKDPICWTRYCNYYNSVVAEYNSINQYGVNGGTRQHISNLRTNFSVIRAIGIAYEKRYNLAQEQYNRLKSSPNLRCDKYYWDLSVDDFLDGKTPKVNYHY